MDSVRQQHAARLSVSTGRRSSVADNRMEGTQSRLKGHPPQARAMSDDSGGKSRGGKGKEAKDVSWGVALLRSLDSLIHVDSPRLYAKLFSWKHVWVIRSVGPCWTVEYCRPYLNRHKNLLLVFVLFHWSTCLDPSKHTNDRKWKGGEFSIAPI